MTTQRAYLDHNASAPLRAAARAAVIAALEVGGNPSSVHAEGRAARAIVDGARERVAALIGARPSEVVFTSGATEANAAVFATRWDMMFVAALEHPSVLAPAAVNGGRVVEVAARGDGTTAVDAFADRVVPGDKLGRAMAALQLANNETGIIQPVAELAAWTRAHDIFLHCDAVQAAGRIAIDFAALGADTLALSSHKIGGPKGVGALVIRDGVTPPVLLAGGGQERRRRGGTENVTAIAGFGAAADAALRDLGNMDRVAGLRDRIERAILQATPEVRIVGRDAARLANTSCVAWPGKLAETLVIKLDLMGFAVSAGSACSSGKVERSRVLTAMGLEDDLAAGAIRISIGAETTQDECDRFIAAWRMLAAPGGNRARQSRTDATEAGVALQVTSGVH